MVIFGIPSFSMGSWLMVTLPAALSTFFPPPAVMACPLSVDFVSVAGCAALSAAAKPPDGNSSPAAMVKASRWDRMVLFPRVPVRSASASVADPNLADHAPLEMAGLQAGEIERTGLGEMPDQRPGLARVDGHGIRIVMLHLGELAHERRVLLELVHAAEHHFVLEASVVLHHKSDRFASLHVDVRRLKTHVVSHPDIDGARHLPRVAGFAKFRAVPLRLLLLAPLRRFSALAVVVGERTGRAEAERECGGDDQWFHSFSPSSFPDSGRVPFHSKATLPFGCLYQPGSL